jgi:hypothetical protein
MSLTLRVVPQELMPTYNQVVIVATSSRQSLSNYQLVTDIWCRGVNVTRMKSPVNPEGYIIVDLHKHLENRISYDFNPGLTAWSVATNSFATYSVDFYDEFREEWEFYDNVYQLVGATAYIGFIGATNGPEPNFDVGDYIYVSQDPGFLVPEYNGAHTITAISLTTSNRWIIRTDNRFVQNTPPNPGVITYANYDLTTLPVGTIETFMSATGTTLTQSTTASSFPTKYVFNGVLDFIDFPNWNFDDWDTNTLKWGKFFTNAPDYYELDIDSYMFLNVYQNITNEVGRLRIKTNVGTYSITNSNTNITTNAQNRFLQISCNPKDLYTLGYINSSTTQIEIWCENTSNQKTVYSKYFKISNRCSRYDKMQILFMDKMGSFLPYTFNKVNRENRTIARTNYQQNIGSYASSTQNWRYNSYDRGTKSLDTIVVEQYTLNSDWVNQNTSDYLMELFESPEAYLVRPDGTILAISINVAAVERKQVINEQLINYVLTFELSNKNMQQRG